MSIARQYGIVASTEKPDVNKVRAEFVNTADFVNALPPERKAKIEKRTAELVAKETAKRGRPATVGARKDMAAYMRARRAKKP